MRDLLGIRLVLATTGVAAAGAFGLIAGDDDEMVAGIFLAGIGVIAVTVQATLSIGVMVQLRLGWVTVLDLIRQALLVAGIFALVAADAGIVPFLALAPLMAARVPAAHRVGREGDGAAPSRRSTVRRWRGAPPGGAPVPRPATIIAAVVLPRQR